MMAHYYNTSFNIVPIYGMASSLSNEKPTIGFYQFNQFFRFHNCSFKAKLANQLLIHNVHHNILIDYVFVGDLLCKTDVSAF
jgi:hypothetical protein